MTSLVSYHRYVRLDDLEAALRDGWVADGLGPLHAPHGCYAVMLTWPHPDPPLRAGLGDGDVSNSLAPQQLLT